MYCSSKEVICRQILVSSAYNAMLVPGEICDVISFINNINKVGPMIEP